MTEPIASAIVPIHNEVHVLPRVLDAIDAQSVRPRELILVFDRCTDGSEAVAVDRADATVRIDEGNTAAAVRAGIEVASHERLVLFDGNTLVPRNYVEQLVRVQDETAADIVEWHGGLMALWKSTLARFGSFSDLYLWTLEYFLRVESSGGTVVHLDGPLVRLKASPLRRNLQYGLEYADLSHRFGLAPFFRIGTKSGWIPDAVAEFGAAAGHIRRGRVRDATAAVLREFGKTTRSGASK